ARRGRGRGGAPGAPAGGPRAGRRTPPPLRTPPPARPAPARRYVLDWSKIRRELGWEPRIPFEQGLADTVAWYADHRDWWEPLRERAPVVEGSAWSNTPG